MLGNKIVDLLTKTSTHCAWSESYVEYEKEKESLIYIDVEGKRERFRFRIVRAPANTQKPLQEIEILHGTLMGFLHRSKAFLFEPWLENQ